MLLTIKFHSHSSGPNQICPLILPSIKNIERLCYKYLFHDLNHSTGPLRSFQRSAEIETILFVRLKTCKVSQMRLSYFFFNTDEFGAHDSIVLDWVLSCKIFLYMTNPMGTCCKITQNDQSVCIAVDFVFSSGQTKMPCWAKLSPPLTFFFFLACVGRPICTCLNKLEEQLCNSGLSMLALCD